MVTIFPPSDRSIFKHQNCNLLLKCLVAQRQEYSRAKKAEAYKGWLIPTVAFIAILAFILDISCITATSSLMAIFSLLCSKHICEYVHTQRKKAAAIQQFFDVTLYSGVLCISKSEWGELPTNTDIADAVSLINESFLNEVKDWYSDYSNLPPEQQVFYCQRENIRWDQNLRKKYYTFQLILLVIMIVFTLVVAMLVNPTFIKMICVIAWVLPVVDYVIESFITLRKDNKRLDELNNKCNKLEVAISNQETSNITAELISIQQAIRKNRENSFMVPDWFYNSMKPNQQKKEDQIANIIQGKI